LALAAVCLFSTVLNRMSFRFVLVPMGQLTHLLSITTNFVYIAFFSLVCLLKARSGGLAKDNQDFVVRGEGRWLLAAAGLAECTAFTAMPLFARQLPGSMLAVLSQSMLPFSMLFSIAVFRRTYDALQILGVGVVMLGIATCAYPKYVADIAAGAGAGAGGAFLLNAAGLLLSYSFIAGSFVFKEKAFRAYSAANPEGKLDNNVVNLAAAVWQCAALWLLWPFNFKFITPFAPAAYFGKAVGVFTNPATAAVVAVYWAANIYYLGTSLTVVSRLSSVVAMLISALAVPISAFAFCLRWPVLGAEPFSLYTVMGMLVITGGLLLYNHKQLAS
jgi:drug/metabolite transporter (DMT)-like permease